MMRRSHRQRGQAIVEVAILVPFLMLLLLGAFDVSIFASNKVQAISAARHGVRIASQLGGVPNNPAPPSPHTCDGTIASPPATLASIDKQIVAAVVAAAANMSYSSIQHIDVYRPSAVDGKYQVGDHANQYKPDGTAFTPTPPVTTPPAFPLTERCQGPLGSSPSDVSIGVSVTWTYVPTNRLGFGAGTPMSFALIDYSVEKMQQCVDNCL
jgi:hypothetical protein